MKYAVISHAFIVTISNIPLASFKMSCDLSFKLFSCCETLIKNTIKTSIMTDLE